MDFSITHSLHEQKVTEMSKQECSNCHETKTPCACMRNKCVHCGKPVGNITFTLCDECWEDYYSGGELKKVTK